MVPCDRSTGSGWPATSMRASTSAAAGERAGDAAGDTDGDGEGGSGEEPGEPADPPHAAAPRATTTRTDASRVLTSTHTEPAKRVGSGFHLGFPPRVSVVRIVVACRGARRSAWS